MWPWMAALALVLANPACPASVSPPEPRMALDVLFRGEVAPLHFSGHGGLLPCGRAQGEGEWSAACAAIEAQAAVLEARADEVRRSVHPDTSVGLKLRQVEGRLSVGELDPIGPAALSGGVELDDELVAIDELPVRGLNLFEATALLRGAPASELSLTLVRAGCRHNVTLQRCADSARHREELAPHQRLSAEDRLRLAAGGSGGSAGGGIWSTGIVLGEELVVAAVAQSSSAAAAGVRVGDKLLSVDGMRVTGGEPAKVGALLTSRHVGTQMSLLLARASPVIVRGDNSATSTDVDTGRVARTCVERGGDSLKPVLVAVSVHCAEPQESSGGEVSRGDVKAYSTKQTLKAVKGLFKGLFT